MKIALLQDEIHLPSFAGGTKANRRLLEALVEQGHDCLALARALTRSPDGPNNLNMLRAELESRNLSIREREPDVFSYEFNGVCVDAINCDGSDARTNYLVRRIREFAPDWVMVADDKRRFLLHSAAIAARDRYVPLLQTIIHLPFGPLSVQPDPRQTQLMREAPGIVVISRYMQEYIRDHGAMSSEILPLPVYGSGPFPNLAKPDSGMITMINPCELKGVSIFVALAEAFPHESFAAVPTWGANPDIVNRLQTLPNVCLLDPVDDIEMILLQTRILLVPSLWPETFGYVVPEAMLRGIPVLASDLGGLRESKLGIEYLLPVRPARRRDGEYVCPSQDITPWSNALTELIQSPETYENCSKRSRLAAEDFVNQVKSSRLESFLDGLASQS